MLNLIEMALNNNVLYIAIILVLLIIIFVTIRSIKKDRDAYKKVVNNYEPAKTEEEKQKAKFELEKVVDEMQKNLDKKETSYRPPMEDDEDMVISYEELVKAVKDKDTTSEVRSEVGMEVADTTFIEEPETKERIYDPEPTDAEDMFIDEELPEKEEEKSILDELVEERLNQEDIENLEEVADNIEEDIQISDVEDKITEEPEIEIKEELEQTRPYEASNFKSTEFISPIFGKDVSTDSLVNMKKQETITREDDLDMEEEDEFLDSLKNFRKNL